MNNQTWVLVALAAIIVLGGALWAFAGPGSTPTPGSPTPANATPTTSQSPSTVNSGENAPPGSIHNLPAEPAAVEARKALAARLGAPVGSIVIMLVEPRTWNDGCLGLGGPAESCIQMLVDGFKVELDANGETYVYRTDKTGASVRAEAN